MGHGREGVSYSISEGRWEDSCVNPGPALIQDGEEDTLNEYRARQENWMEVKIESHMFPSNADSVLFPWKIEVDLGVFHTHLCRTIIKLT